jgi:hypothetical protein
MKIQHTIIIATALVPALAAAQPAAPTPSTPTPTGPAATDAPPPDMSASRTSGAPPPAPGIVEEPQVRLGAELSILPTGSLTAEANNQSMSVDTATAIGVGAVLQFPLNSIFTVDLAPRYVFNVKGNDDDESATELDLRARLTAGGRVAPAVRLYAAVEPGYSILFPPDAPSGIEMSNPKGLTLGLAAGAAFTVQPRLQVTGEIGYQFGFQSATVSVLGQSADFDLKSNYLHIALGLLFDL